MFLFFHVEDNGILVEYAYSFLTLICNTAHLDFITAHFSLITAKMCSVTILGLAFFYTVNHFCAPYNEFLLLVWRKYKLHTH